MTVNSDENSVTKVHSHSVHTYVIVYPFQKKTPGDCIDIWYPRTACNHYTS